MATAGVPRVSRDRKRYGSVAVDTDATSSPTQEPLYPPICAMSRPAIKTPDDLHNLLCLIDTGCLFEVQAWINAGQRFTLTAGEHPRFCPLHRSFRTGFHSLFKVLLDAADYPAEALDCLLNQAISKRRLDLADLLLAKGASRAAVDFEDV